MGGPPGAESWLRLLIAQNFITYHSKCSHPAALTALTNHAPHATRHRHIYAWVAIAVVLYAEATIVSARTSDATNMLRAASPSQPKKKSRAPAPMRPTTEQKSDATNGKAIYNIKF